MTHLVHHDTVAGATHAAPPPGDLQDAATHVDAATPADASHAATHADATHADATHADTTRASHADTTQADAGHVVRTHVDHDDAGDPSWRIDPAAAFRGSAMGGDMHADLCVVGLGGTGLAAVETGLEHDLDVVGLDAAEVAGAAAGRNGGLLLAGMAAFHHDAVRRHGRERATAWYRATMDERDRLASSDPTIMVQSGSLRVADSAEEARDLDAMLAAMRADDLPVERATHDMGPALAFPGDAACNPWLRCQRLARRLHDAGARLVVNTPATAVAPGTVTTPCGTVRAGQIVVAVDGGLARLVPSVAGRVRPVRLQMVGTSITSRVVAQPVYRRWGLDYWQQLPDGRIALGGGRDRGGTDEDTDLAVPSEPVQAWLTDLAGVVAPDASVTHRWAAIVGFTEEGVPVCEQVGDGVWALGGYSGTGNVVGPLLAREVVASIATGSPTRLLTTLVGPPAG